MDLSSILGGGTPGAATGQMDPQKMMLAQALMGGGGSGGPPANSFAGGLSQGMSPMLHMAMMQKLMGQQQPQQPTMAPNADMGGPAMTPYMLGGAPTS